MTTIVRRSDCQCGGITGLFFDHILIQRAIDNKPYPDVLAEYHYPHGYPRRCQFFLNGLELSAERVLTMIVNNAAARVENEISTSAPRGVAAGRAADILGRYAAQPDNP